MVIKNVDTSENKVHVVDVKVFRRNRGHAHKRKFQNLVLPFDEEVTVSETDEALRSFDAGDIKKLVDAGAVTVVTPPTRTLPPVGV